MPGDNGASVTQSSIKYICFAYNFAYWSWDYISGDV